jgi:hypothetical protein
MLNFFVCRDILGTSYLIKSESVAVRSFLRVVALLSLRPRVAILSLCSLQSGTRPSTAVNAEPLALSHPFLCFSPVVSPSVFPADIDVTCFEGTWMQHLPIVITLCVLYPVGIPAFCGLLLRRYRTRLLEPGVRLQVRRPSLFCCRVRVCVKPVHRVLQFYPSRWNHAIPI